MKLYVINNCYRVPQVKYGSFLDFSLWSWFIHKQLQVTDVITSLNVPLLGATLWKPCEVHVKTMWICWGCETPCETSCEIKLGFLSKIQLHSTMWKNVWKFFHDFWQWKSHVKQPVKHLFILEAKCPLMLWNTLWNEKPFNFFKKVMSIFYPVKFWDFFFVFESHVKQRETWIVNKDTPPCGI